MIEIQFVDAVAVVDTRRTRLGSRSGVSREVQIERYRTQTLRRVDRFRLNKQVLTLTC